MQAEILTGAARTAAIEILVANHYAGTVPSGKSHYVKYGDAIIVWSIPGNPYLAKSLGVTRQPWELSRMWAPDGHEPDLLTRAISAAVKIIRKLENPEIVVSYADPNAFSDLHNRAHTGTVYRAAGWIQDTKTEARGWMPPKGCDACPHCGRPMTIFDFVPRRHFNINGHVFIPDWAVLALGFTKVKRAPKLRFVKHLVGSRRRRCARHRRAMRRALVRRAGLTSASADPSATFPLCEARISAENDASMARFQNNLDQQQRERDIQSLDSEIMTDRFRNRF